MMRNNNAAIYLTVAALAIVTVIGVSHTDTSKTGNIALAQAMFTADGQVPNHTANDLNDLQ